MVKRWEELSREEIETLIVSDVLNGCGAAKGIDFDPVVKALKGKECSEELKEEVCYPHDYRYHYGKSLFDKLLADIKFLFDLFFFLKGQDIKFINRLMISIISCIGLILFGGKAFKENKDGEGYIEGNK